MVPTVVESLLKFLNDNSGAIAAIAATAGVIIAALYTFYTTRLWRVSLQQARSAELQAESSQRQLRLMEQQMAAAERTFETVHRPHLLVEAQVDLDAADLGTKGKVSMLAILAKNYGATAATVMSAECSVPKGEGSLWVHLLLPIVIPPGETELIGRALLPSTPDVDVIRSREGIEGIEGINKVMRWFHVYIRYRGLSESEYQAKGQISLMPDMKDTTRWTIQSVTPTGSEFWEIHGGGNETELAVGHNASASE